MFRFALENWQPDSYVAFVLHRNELTSEQTNLIDTLRSKDFSGTHSANLIVKTINLDAEPGEFATTLRQENASPKLPCVVVQTPAKGSQPETVFAEELTPTNVAQLIDSPLRMDIKDRLLKGDSVVWVYLECGREQKDDETFSLLTRELSRLQGELELPEIEEEDLSDLATSPESLKIQFSAVRLSRDDNREVAFRDMLLHVEHDLLDEAYIDQPMDFPIFGRGRALYALVGDGLAPELIEEACRFLTGACQCTVKAENPGVDLLMQVEWDRLIQPTEAVDASLPPLAGFTGFGQGSGNSSADIQMSQNTVSLEENRELNPSKPVSGVEPLQVTASAVDAGDQPVDLHNGIEAAAPAASVVWRNVNYVLLLAGCGVIFATLLLTRKSGE